MPTGGQIYPSEAALSAKATREGLADAFTAIKRADVLTDEAMGEPLCRSADRVKDYRGGDADVSAPTLKRAIAKWGRRIGDPFLEGTGWRLTEIDAVCSTDGALTANARLGLKLAIAGPDVTPERARGMMDEVRQMQAILDGIAAKAGEQ